eukprot:CAMPEP_0183358984 /NCGR_PEP_ID=MMETSP0164_2-20130417/50919_1 /TAXON_ID=221442 /ORGANISM="Coccolithus pelagicus ssp braarudi, Strain PLY182g" /LENGTH=57 /DNA_ID=CAMNT_0025533001 /DNA_START=237 /DNA_END=407 /DNA_ORIENTATION=-
MCYIGLQLKWVPTCAHARLSPLAQPPTVCTQFKKPDTKPADLRIATAACRPRGGGSG